MNIAWNSTDGCFEAELTPGDQWWSDQEAAKAAGFKTQGPPSWLWQTRKVGPLNKLRKNRPMSGLTISPEALEKYAPLQVVEQALADFKKAAKKATKESEKHQSAIPVDKWWIGAGDLPPWEVKCQALIITTPIPELKCSICGEPVYSYEKQDPPMCIYCEKVLDNARGV